MDDRDLALRFFIVNFYGYENDLRPLLNNIEKLKNDFDLKRLRLFNNRANRFTNNLTHLFGKENINKVFQVLSKNEKPPSNNNLRQHFFSGIVNQGLYHLFAFYLPKYNQNQIRKVSKDKFTKNLLKLLKTNEFINVVTGSGTNSKRNILKSKQLFEKYFLLKTFGHWTDEEKRNISRSSLKTLVDNIEFCYLSYTPISSKKLKKVIAEHIDAFASGHSSELMNILPALKECNTKKGVKNIENYRNTRYSIKLRRKIRKIF